MEKQPLETDSLHVWWWPDRLQPTATTRRQRTDAILRTLLARYLPIDADSLLFGREPKGRPFLQHGWALDFNLSDTGGGTVLAVAWHARVGIDIERSDRTPPVARLAARWFATDEADALQQMEPECARRAFLHLWTAKEAACKATGTGIFGYLSTWRFGVDAAAASPQLHGLPAAAGDTARWRFHRLTPAPFHTVALACRDNMATPVGFEVIE
ncbi:MAG TPA: 4'-phosphopantetheinyl transferase superfamily protein [Xanthomonadaceae bacterium]|nr:4'-phosphopantetheinyl transferase superfamily protein [Xanthomonadaceae bacterium]